MMRYDPFSEEVIDDPYPFYKRLRDEAPLYYREDYDCWFISRFQDVWHCELDTKSFTVTEGLMPFQLLTEDKITEEIFEDRDFGAVLAGMDPPDHTRLRPLISPHFKPAAARELEAFTRHIVRGFVDEFAGRGECDVVGDLAMRTSVRVACKISGLPLEEADWFVENINKHFHRNPGGEGFSEIAMQATLALHSWLEEFVAKKRVQRDDQPNALNTLFDLELNGARLEDRDIQGNLMLMLVGGTETLPKAFSGAVNRLGENPDQRAELVADPSLIPGAFHEALRYDMPTQMLGRRVVREKVLGDQVLKPGSGILYLFASANRDEREFPDPDRFDIHRNAPRILTFGAGPHMCLGAHVARMEGKIMLEELLARVPVYEVQRDEAVRLRSEFFQGFASLPIRFAA